MSKTNRAKRRTVILTDIDLMMECMDDELSPWQKQAMKKAELDYNKVMAEIRQAQSCDNTVVQATQGAHIPTPPPKKVKPPVTPANDPDVIIIDDNIPSTAKPAQPLQTSKPVSGHITTQHPVPATQYILTSSIGQGGTPILVPQHQFSQYQLVGGTLRPQQIRTQASTGILPNTTQILNIPRAPTSIPVQRVHGQPRVAANHVVSGTFGLGVKRSGNIAEEEPKTKRTRKAPEQNDQGSWVPLDEYYYGKKEGDPAYREEKSEFRFKCWYCHKMLYNNLRVMMHMQGHIDSEKQQNLDLSDLTQCKHCYKQFDTPFEMQCHIEKVHQNNANVLVCRICEKDHDNQQMLRAHMRACHNSCEMPYICQLCNFRSSVYSDVVDHFKKRHDSSEYVMCLYCLRVFKINFSKANGWGLTQNYYQHLQKHQVKNSLKKCPCCKLTFLNKVDAKNHRARDHLPNHKGILAGSGSSAISSSSCDKVMIKLPEQGLKSNQPKTKSLNAPTHSKVQEYRNILFGSELSRYQCMECKNPMVTADHYRKYVECSMCRFATTCGHAYANHMISFHSGQQQQLQNIPKERPMSRLMFCWCGYSSKYGNAIANHLVFCSKRTCYTSKPELRYIEYEDVEEFNPFEPYEADEPDPEPEPVSSERSLFDVLGLVKRQNTRQTTPPTKTEQAPSSAEEVIPPELTGERKWDTVKIADSKAPSKDSIFIGSEIQNEDLPDSDNSQTKQARKAEDSNHNADNEDSKLSESVQSTDDKKIETVLDTDAEKKDETVKQSDDLSISEENGKDSVKDTEDDIPYSNRMSDDAEGTKKDAEADEKIETALDTDAEKKDEAVKQSDDLSISEENKKDGVKGTEDDIPDNNRTSDNAEGTKKDAETDVHSPPESESCLSKSEVEGSGLESAESDSMEQGPDTATPHTAEGANSVTEITSEPEALAEKDLSQSTAMETDTISQPVAEITSVEEDNISEPVTEVSPVGVDNTPQSTTDHADDGTNEGDDRSQPVTGFTAVEADDGSQQETGAICEEVEHSSQSVKESTTSGTANSPQHVTNNNTLEVDGSLQQVMEDSTMEVDENSKEASEVTFAELKDSSQSVTEVNDTCPQSVTVSEVGDSNQTVTVEAEASITEADDSVQPVADRAAECIHSTPPEKDQNVGLKETCEAMDESTTPPEKDQDVGLKETCEAVDESTTPPEKDQDVGLKETCEGVDESTTPHEKDQDVGLKETCEGVDESTTVPEKDQDIGLKETCEAVDKSTKEKPLQSSSDNLQENDFNKKEGEEHTEREDTVYIRSEPKEKVPRDLSSVEEESGGKGDAKSKADTCHLQTHTDNKNECTSNVPRPTNTPPTVGGDVDGEKTELNLQITSEAQAVTSNPHTNTQSPRTQQPSKRDDQHHTPNTHQNRPYGRKNDRDFQGQQYRGHHDNWQRGGGQGFSDRGRGFGRGFNNRGNWRGGYNDYQHYPQQDGSFFRNRRGRGHDNYHGSYRGNYYGNRNRGGYY